MFPANRKNFVFFVFKFLMEKCTCNLPIILIFKFDNLVSSEFAFTFNIVNFSRTSLKFEAAYFLFFILGFWLCEFL